MQQQQAVLTPIDLEAGSLVGCFAGGHFFAVKGGALSCFKKPFDVATLVTEGFTNEAGNFTLLASSPAAESKCFAAVVNSTGASKARRGKGGVVCVFCVTEDGLPMEIASAPVPFGALQIVWVDGGNFLVVGYESKVRIFSFDGAALTAMDSDSKSCPCAVGNHLALYDYERSFLEFWNLRSNEKVSSIGVSTKETVIDVAGVGNTILVLYGSFAVGLGEVVNGKYRRTGYFGEIFPEEKENPISVNQTYLLTYGTDAEITVAIPSSSNIVVIRRVQEKWTIVQQISIPIGVSVSSLVAADHSLLALASADNKAYCIDLSAIPKPDDDWSPLREGSQKQSEKFPALEEAHQSPPSSPIRRAKSHNETTGRVTEGNGNKKKVIVAGSVAVLVMVLILRKLFGKKK